MGDSSLEGSFLALLLSLRKFLILYILDARLKMFQGHRRLSGLKRCWQPNLNVPRRGILDDRLATPHVWRALSSQLFGVLLHKLLEEAIASRSNRDVCPQLRLDRTLLPRGTIILTCFELRPRHLRVLEHKLWIGVAILSRCNLLGQNTSLREVTTSTVAQGRVSICFIDWYYDLLLMDLGYHLLGQLPRDSVSYR